MVPTQHVGEEEGGRERDQRPYGERFERERARLVIEFENCCLKRCENCCLKSVVKKRVF